MKRRFVLSTVAIVSTLALTSVFAGLLTVPAAAQIFPRLTRQDSGTNQLLIAVSPVNAKVVWAAGTNGTFVVTTDGGQTWRSGQVPGAKDLQFRGVRAVSENIAY